MVSDHAGTQHGMSSLWQAGTGQCAQQSAFAVAVFVGADLCMLGQHQRHGNADPWSVVDFVVDTDAVFDALLAAVQPFYCK